MTFKVCDHIDNDEVGKPDPEEMEALKAGVCPQCQIKAGRVGPGYICKCCGVEWRVRSSSIIVTISLKLSF